MLTKLFDQKFSTFPRSVYEKPPIDPVTGKPGKEKLVKKAERVWQQEVREGEEIKRGEHKDAGAWKKLKGAAARVKMFFQSKII